MRCPRSCSTSTRQWWPTRRRSAARRSTRRNRCPSGTFTSGSYIRFTCHPERSEGSVPAIPGYGFLAEARNDKGREGSCTMVMAGEVVIITGGAGGIGRHLAHRFAQEKCRVVVADIRPMDTVLGELKAVGSDAAAVH